MKRREKIVEGLEVAAVLQVVPHTLGNGQLIGHTFNEGLPLPEALN
jgi:hypothetical protein